MDNQLTAPTQGSETRLFIVLGIALAFIALISIIFGLSTERGDVSAPTERARETFPPVVLGAKAAYVYDLRTKEVLYAKNEDARLPLASLTKVMTALVAREIGQLYSTVVITDSALATEGDSGLYRDERWSLKNLLDFSLLTSSNDGMRAVALSLGALSEANATDEEIIKDFVLEMNKKAGELGLKNTYFWNETGLDVPVDNNKGIVKGGAYGTVKDMTQLLEHVYTNYPELLSATKDATGAFYSLDNQVHIARNTNGLAGEIPGLLASKTGFTDTAGGNLVIIFDPEIGRPIIVSVLGSTEQGRFQDVNNLVQATMSYITNN